MTEQNLSELEFKILNCVQCSPHFIAVKPNQVIELIAYILSSQAQPTPDHSEPVAQAYINTDGECEQIDWLGTINPKIDDEFTPLYTKPQPTSQEVVDASALIIESVVNELKEYSPQGDKCNGEHIHKYWAKTLSGALDAMKESK